MLNLPAVGITFSVTGISNERDALKFFPFLGRMGRNFTGQALAEVGKTIQ
jgi:hypothetical protein